jgi:short-subunit dehydrogenase
MTDIRNKVTLITGAAKGMGREMAGRFAREGAHLVLVDIDGDNLAETADEIRSQGYTVDTFVRDLSSRETIRRLRDEVVEQVGGVDILVNNAGIVQGGPLDEIDDEADELTLKVNIEAVHWMTKAFLPDLKEGRDGHIVQMASAAGLIGIPYQVVYSASKWFVLGHAEALRQELRHDGADHVGLTVVCPSLVDTGMFEGSDPPMLAPILEPDYMADQIIEAVRREWRTIREPSMVKLLPYLTTLLPAEIIDFLLDKLGASSLMHGWEGRQED